MEEEKKKKALAEKVAEILKANKNALYIGRIPPEYKRKFIQWAKEQFCDDYGMLLVHLMDVVGLADKRYEELNEKLDAVINWIQSIEEKIMRIEKDKPESVKKTVSGKILKD